MKLQYIYLILLSTSLITCTEPTNKDFNVNLNINMNQNQDATNAQATHQFQSSQQKQINTQDFLQNLYHEPLQKSHESIVSVWEYITHNKIKCSCAAIIALYAYTAYYIYTTEQQANNSSAWCNWQNHTSIETFLTLPTKETGRQLLHEIQSRYADPENPTNFIYSLVQFIKILEEEIEQLKNLKDLYLWIEFTGCSRLFLIDAKSIATIQEKLHKTLFIKHIFATWYANYKIDKNL